MKQSDILGLAAAIDILPDQAQIERLFAYEQMLKGRGVERGLVGASDSRRMWERHILDCMRAAAVSPEEGQALDLGSGAGLPGIVVAIIRPSLIVTLVEKRARRVAFLEWALEGLRLGNARVVRTDIEDLPSSTADICYSRALASVSVSWDIAMPLLKPGGSLVYFAGRGANIPRSVPGAARIEVSGTKMLESSGPLVIITR